MIARAAVASLAILAGALVTPPAAAEPPAPAPPASPPPVAAPPVAAPPAYAPPGYAPVYVPPGYPPPIFYAPWPVDPRSAWPPAEGESSPAPPPPPPPARDPLILTGLGVGVAGLLTTALGAGLFVSASSAQTTCGLSGCLDLPDKQRRSAAAATIAGGASAALFGGALVLAGARGPTPPRRSNARMVAGIVFTALGLGAASGSVLQAVLLTPRDTLPGEVFPVGTSRAAAHDALTPAALALTAGACFAMGLPLWITGALAPPAPRKDRPAARPAELAVLPSAGGVALRWTR